MKEIIFFNSSLRGGGVETVLKNILKYIEIENFKIKVILFDEFEDNDLNEKFSEKNIEIITYKIKKFNIKNPLNYLIQTFQILCLYFKIKKVINEESILINMNIMNFQQNLLFKLLKNKKKIGWLHCDLTQYVNSYHYNLRKIFWKEYIKVIVVSKEALDVFSIYNKKLKNKAHYIPNFVDRKEIEKKSNEELNIKESYFLFVGRLSSEKNLEVLIESYKQADVSEKLFLIGDGPEKKKLKEMVIEKKVEEKVKFLGHKNNPYKWMKNAKALILTSKMEGLPMVLIEALFCNTLLISSDCKSGPKEILENKYGILFPVGKIECLVKIIKKVSYDREYRNDIIKNLDKKKQEYTKEVVMKKIVSLLKEEL